jgi:hypothetical protein
MHVTWAAAAAVAVVTAVIVVAAAVVVDFAAHAEFDGRGGCGAAVLHFNLHLTPNNRARARMGGACLKGQRPQSKTPNGLT